LRAAAARCNCVGEAQWFTGAVMVTVQG
jgi:hypothetical protein